VDRTFFYFFVGLAEKNEDSDFIPVLSTLLNFFWAIVSFSAYIERQETRFKQQKQQKQEYYGTST